MVLQDLQENLMRGKVRFVEMDYSFNICSGQMHALFCIHTLLFKQNFYKILSERSLRQLEERGRVGGQQGDGNIINSAPFYR